MIDTGRLRTVHAIDAVHRARCLTVIGVDPFVVRPELLLRRSELKSSNPRNSADQNQTSRQVSQRSIQTLSALRQTESLLEKPVAPLAHSANQAPAVESLESGAETTPAQQITTASPFFVLNATNQFCWFALIETDDAGNDSAGNDEIRRSQTLFDSLSHQFGSRLNLAADSPEKRSELLPSAVCFKWPPVNERVLSGLGASAAINAVTRCVSEYIPAAAAASRNAEAARIGAPSEQSVAFLFANHDCAVFDEHSYVNWNVLADLPPDALRDPEKLMLEINQRIVLLPALNSLLQHAALGRRLQLLLILIAVAAGLREASPSR